ncbi:mucin-2-like [Halichondria panicea]|uniref:mucin-2-like n=1 Tax=Halichondria panicea TaxID=6063 RepID=UPI00312B9E4D
MGKRIRRRFKKVIKTVTKIIFCRGCSTQVIPIDDNQTDTNPKHSKMKEKLKQKVMSRSAKNRAERPINETSTPITVVAATNYSTSTGTSIGPVDSETTTAVATTSHSTSAGTSIGPADSETPTPTTIIIAAIATTSHFTSARTSIGPAHGETSTTVAATVSSARTTGPDRCSPDASTHTNTVDQEYLQTNEDTVMLSVASEPVVIPRIPSAELLEKLEKFIENQEVTSRPLPDHCEIVDTSLPCNTEQDEPLKLSVSDMLCIQNDPDLADHMDRFQGGVTKREPLYIVIDTKLSSPTIFQFDHPLFREGCFASHVHRKKDISRILLVWMWK